MMKELSTLCNTCQRVNSEHQRPPGLLQPLHVPEWKWEEIAMEREEGLKVEFLSFFSDPSESRGRDSF
jgi:hypothetical protein